MPSPRSNNTNKLSPQEPATSNPLVNTRSNNTNKLSPQEHCLYCRCYTIVQIIQINLVLKNRYSFLASIYFVQIIQINLVLKNIAYAINIIYMFK